LANTYSDPGDPADPANHKWPIFEVEFKGSPADVDVTTVSMYSADALPAPENMPMLEELTIIQEQAGIAELSTPEAIMEHAKLYEGTPIEQRNQMRSELSSSEATKSITDKIQEIPSKNLSRLLVHPAAAQALNVMSHRWVLTIVAANVSGLATYYGFYSTTGSAKWALGAGLMMANMDGIVQSQSARIGTWVTDVENKFTRKGAWDTLVRRAHISIPIVSLLVAVKVASPAITWEPTAAFATNVYLNWSAGIAGMLLASTPQIETLKRLESKGMANNMDGLYRITFFSLTMFARTAMIVGVVGAPTVSTAMLFGLGGLTSYGLHRENRKFLLRQVEADRLLKEQIRIDTQHKPQGPSGPCGNVFSGIQ